MPRLGHIDPAEALLGGRCSRVVEAEGVEVFKVEGDGTL
jgi:hypothetical protein